MELRHRRLLGIIVLFGSCRLLGSTSPAPSAAAACSGSCCAQFVAAICLLPPTLLMGASLPAIARWVEIAPRGVSWLGFLYSGNIAGAVFGCLLAGFYLLRVYDMAYCHVCRGRDQRSRRVALLSPFDAGPAGRADRRGDSPDREASARRPAARACRYIAIAPLGPDRARRGSRLDAAAFAHAGRDRLHVLDHSRRVSYRFGPGSGARHRISRAG